MLINKKFIATIGLVATVAFVGLTSMAPDDGPKNIKVLPKHVTEQQIHTIMREWALSLGVRCNFCHAANADGKGLDFASDAKPEKETARHMFKMMNKINEKYFEAKKDSTGMMMHSGINCNTCHRGNAHPEVTVPEPPKGPAGPPPGGPGAPPKQ